MSKRQHHKLHSYYWITGYFLSVYKEKCIEGLKCLIRKKMLWNCFHPVWNDALMTREYDSHRNGQEKDFTHLISPDYEISQQNDTVTGTFLCSQTFMTITLRSFVWQILNFTALLVEKSPLTTKRQCHQTQSWQIHVMTRVKVFYDSY